MSPEDLNSYTVKEMLSQFVIPALEDLRKSAIATDLVNNERFTKLEAWRNRVVGALGIITAILIPISIPLIITVVSAHHG